MTLQPVKSGAIRAIGYDSTARELHVEFASGHRYVYEGVEPADHDALISAESIGKHFASSIKPDRKFRKVER